MVKTLMYINTNLRNVHKSVVYPVCFLAVVHVSAEVDASFVVSKKEDS